jgi:hypothetical protein
MHRYKYRSDADRPRGIRGEWGEDGRRGGMGGREKNERDESGMHTLAYTGWWGVRPESHTPPTTVCSYAPMLMLLWRKGLREEKRTVGRRK